MPFFGLFRDRNPRSAVACWGNKIRGLRSGEDLALNDEQREAQLDLYRFVAIHGSQVVALHDQYYFQRPELITTEPPPPPYLLLLGLERIQSREVGSQSAFHLKESRAASTFAWAWYIGRTSQRTCHLPRSKAGCGSKSPGKFSITSEAPDVDLLA